jgi:hypothetical protein
MKTESTRADLKAIADVLNASTPPGIFAKEAARAALGRIKEHIAFDRTQREYLAADLVALAEGKPVRTALAEAVRVKMGAL